MNKYVIELLFEDLSKINGVSDWQMKRAIETALKTLNHKKHELGTKVSNVIVQPMRGSLATAVDLVAAIKSETEASTRERVDEHENSYRHEDGDYCDSCGR